MIPRLDGYAAAVLGQLPADRRGQVARELVEVRDLLVANDLLRVSLIDTSVSATARHAVLDELLRERISADACRMVGFAAGTVRAPEVPTAISWLAHAAAAGHLSDDNVDDAVAVPDRVIGRERIDGFAAAVFEDDSTGELEELEDALFRFARTVETTPVLREVLTDAQVPAGARRGVVTELLSGKVSASTLRLCQYVAASGRPRDVVGTLYRLVERCAEARGWRVALVTTARDIDAPERDLLTGALRGITGTPVELQLTVDPALLSGVRVLIGDLRIDATVQSRLDQFRDHVSFGGWEDTGLGAVQSHISQPADAPSSGATREASH